MGAKHSTTHDVDKFLKQQQQQEDRTYRILLLGPGDSGKSTILKQMIKIEALQKNDNSLDYTDSVPFIREAAMNYMHILCNENRSLSNNNALNNEMKEAIKVNDDNIQLRNYMADLQQLHWHNMVNNKKNNNDEKNDDDDDDMYDKLFEYFTKHVESHLKPLWSDNGIQNTLKYRAMFVDQIPDNVAYFLDKIDEIAGKEYDPSFDDYIRLRTRTSGAQIEKIDIDLDKLDHQANSNQFGVYTFELTDIGGQKNERNKWARVMQDSIKVVLFVVAVSEYDLPCYEDANKRRMSDALDAFKKLLTHESGVKGQRFVQEKQIVVLFNKHDLLSDKLQEVPLNTIPEFNDFEGDEKSEMTTQAIFYFQNKFRDAIDQLLKENDTIDDKPDPKGKKRSKLKFDYNKNLSFYNSQALNTGLIQSVFHKITLNLVTGNLERMGMTAMSND